MDFRDISTDTHPTYRLAENEQAVFFLLNRSGEVTFELAGVHAKAYVYALFVGEQSTTQTLHLRQHHTALRTHSFALVKSVLMDASAFDYKGTIRLERSADKSEAVQENRNLIVGEGASAFSNPALEILAKDVICRHASTTSAPNADQLFYLMTRGLDQTTAERLIAEGFLTEVGERMKKLGVQEDDVARTLEKTLALFAR